MRVNPTFTGFEEFCTSGTKTEPSAGLKASGYLPLEMLPAQHFNWLVNRASKGVTESQLYVDNINKELNTLLTKAGLSPNNGTDQVDAAILALYNEYDIIIDSQTKFDLWMNNATQAYKRVYIRQGTYDLPSVPAVGNAYFSSALNGTKRIVCENNVTIQAIGLACSFDVTIFDLSVTEMDAPLFNGITFFGTNNLNGALTVFKNMRNLVNCRVLSGGNVSSSVKAFDGCSFLQDCVFSSGGDITGDIYNYCTNLFGCAILSSTSLAASSKRGFFACKNLIRCTFTAGSGGAYTGFSYCEDLTACAYTNSSAGSASGFANCSRLSLCKVSVNSASSGSCFAYCEDMSSCASAFDAYSFSPSLSNCSRVSGFKAAYASVVSGVSALVADYSTDLSDILIDIQTGDLNTITSGVLAYCYRVSSSKVNMALTSMSAPLGILYACEVVTSTEIVLGATAASSGTLTILSGVKDSSALKIAVTFDSTFSSSEYCMNGCYRISDVYASFVHTGTGGAGGLAINSRLLTNVHLYLSVSGRTAASSCFDSCYHLSNCIGHILGSNSAANYAFYNCEFLDNCGGTAANSGAGTGYAFGACKQVHGCCNSWNGASKTGVYTTSYADQSTNACANTAAGGYNKA